MFINCDDNPPYYVAISDYLKTNINSHIKCCRVYPYSTPKGIMMSWINKEIWIILRNCFPEAKIVNKPPITIVR